MKLELNPLCGALGAEVHGVDLSEDLESATMNAIKEAFHDNIVLLFRKQNLTPAQHVDFTISLDQLKHILSAAVKVLRLNRKF